MNERLLKKRNEKRKEENNISPSFSINQSVCVCMCKLKWAFFFLPLLNEFFIILYYCFILNENIQQCVLYCHVVDGTYLWFKKRVKLWMWSNATAKAIMKFAQLPCFRIVCDLFSTFIVLRLSLCSFSIRFDSIRLSVCCGMWYVCVCMMFHSEYFKFIFICLHWMKQKGIQIAHLIQITLCTNFNCSRQRRKFPIFLLRMY